MFVCVYITYSIVFNSISNYILMPHSFRSSFFPPPAYFPTLGLELWRRLELYCPDINQGFLDRLIDNKPHRVNPSDPGWVKRVDNAQHFWYNDRLSQQSWVDVRQYMMNMKRYPILRKRHHGYVNRYGNKA